MLQWILYNKNIQGKVNIQKQGKNYVAFKTFPENI